MFASFLGKIQNYQPPMKHMDFNMPIKIFTFFLAFFYSTLPSTFNISSFSKDPGCLYDSLFGRKLNVNSYFPITLIFNSLKTIFKKFYLCVCVSLYTYITGASCSCEPSNVDAINQTLVLCEKQQALLTTERSPAPLKIIHFLLICYW